MRPSDALYNYFRAAALRCWPPCSHLARVTRIAITIKGRASAPLCCAEGGRGTSPGARMTGMRSWTGHSNTKQTERYVHPTEGGLLAATEVAARANRSSKTQAGGLK